MANKVIWGNEKMNYEKISEKDIGKEVKFTFSKNAFDSEKTYCEECDVRARKVEVEMTIPKTFLSIRLKVFRCPKCNKEYLNFKEAEKLDKLLVLNNMIEKQGVSYTRALNFDGDNIFIRFPTELTRGFDKKSKAEIMPLSMNEFLIKIEK